MHSMLPWKEEPVSPLSSEEASLLDDTFYQSSSLDDIKFENGCFEDCESKAEFASHILENLEKLMDLDELIKAEPSFLLDDKMLPLLDDVEPPRGAIAVPVKSEYYKLPSEESTTYLFNEFEKVYHELHNGTLTPPQSPPSETPIIATLEPLLDVKYHHQHHETAALSVPEKPLQQQLAFPPLAVTIAQNQHIPDIRQHHVVVVDTYGSASTPQPDIAHELAVVDELVRSTIDDMQWASGPSSPESTSSCSRSNFEDSSSDDPEWAPEAAEESYNDTSLSQCQKLPSMKKRSKPYSRSPDDKKNRKKEQNKNAATRYRMKKKAEVEVILTEEKGLMDINEKFTSQITDLEREIKYLKGLMRDLFKAKGLIN